MIEAQDGLNWERWRHLCEDVEGLGFASLRRSDHLLMVVLANRDTLDGPSAIPHRAFGVRMIRKGRKSNGAHWLIGREAVIVMPSSLKPSELVRIKTATMAQSRAATSGGS